MDKIIILILLASLTKALGCNVGHGGYGHGYGWDPSVFVLPKPTLIPRLKHAFIEGKLSVNTYKIVSPSLKPLPYKKGVGWVKKQKYYPHHGLSPPYGVPVHHHGYGYPGIVHGGIGHGGIGGHGHPIGHHPHHPNHYPIHIGRSGHPHSGFGHVPVGQFPLDTPNIPHHHASGVTIVEKGLPGPHHPQFSHKRQAQLSPNAL